jgi:hypothetical protein
LQDRREHIKETAVPVPGPRVLITEHTHNHRSLKRISKMATKLIQKLWFSLERVEARFPGDCTETYWPGTVIRATRKHCSILFDDSYFDERVPLGDIRDIVEPTTSSRTRSSVLSETKSTFHKRVSVQTAAAMPDDKDVQLVNGSLADYANSLHLLAGTLAPDCPETAWSIYQTV